MHVPDQPWPTIHEIVPVNPVLQVHWALLFASEVLVEKLGQASAVSDEVGDDGTKEFRYKI